MSYKDPIDQKKYVANHYLQNKEIYLQRAKESKLRHIQWFKDLKKTFVCSKCGESRPACIEFHHPDPSTKEYSMMEFVNRFGRKKILEEIAKCEILCSNCHKDFHYSQFFNTPV